MVSPQSLSRKQSQSTSQPQLKQQQQQQHQPQQQQQPKRLLKLLNYLGMINILGIVAIIVSEHSMSTIMSTRNTPLSFPLDASYESSLSDSIKSTTTTTSRLSTLNNKHKGINETILRLEYLGVMVDVDYPRLPPWWWIENQYGDHPTILGLDQCQAFRDLNRHHVDDIVIAPSGLFDTGTNLLQRLLEMNCEFQNRDTKLHYHGRAFQPPWGKHTPREFRESHRIPHALYQNMILDAVLPVVLIRHPYDWFKSVCEQPYAIHWKDNANAAAAADITTCPAIVHRDNETQTICVKYGSGDIEYETIAHLWNRWNRAWYDTMAFPRLMIRMEDLIFYPHRVIPQVCHCAGGTMMTSTKPFRVPLESTKMNTTGHKQNHATTFLQAVIKYGNIRTWERFPTWDHMAARTILDKELLDTFGYEHPDMTIVQRNKLRNGIP